MLIPPPVTVILAYDVDPQSGQPVVKVTPAVIQVSPGQAIKFKRAGVMRGTMRVTFKDKDYFEGGDSQFAATGAFHEGDADVHVKTLPARTTYVCELLDPAGHRIAQSLTNTGGAVEPVQN